MRVLYASCLSASARLELQIITVHSLAILEKVINENLIRQDASGELKILCSFQIDTRRGYQSMIFFFISTGPATFIDIYIMLTNWATHFCLWDVKRK